MTSKLTQTDIDASVVKTIRRRDLTLRRDGLDYVFRAHSARGAAFLADQNPFDCDLTYSDMLVIARNAEELGLVVVEC